MTEPAQQPPQRSVVSRFFGDMAHMPGWQKVLLGLALAIGVAGGAGQAYSHFGHRQPPPTAPADSPAGTQPPGRSFVSGSPKTTDAPETAPAPEPTAVQRWSPGLTRTGVSFIGAFIIGWLFRVFVKTMALIAIVGGGIMAALSYFHVINIDFSAAEKTYATASAWLFDQAGHLKDAAMAHLGASSSGVAGLFVGMRKK